MTDQNDFNVKPGQQLASFTIRDILRISTASDSSFESQTEIDESVKNKSNFITSSKNLKRTSNANKISETGKRVRTIFTQDQLDKLEANFERQQYMIRSERTQLAATLNLQETQVKVWFQNRRIKWRKQQHESTMAKIRAYQESSTCVK